MINLNFQKKSFKIIYLRSTVVLQPQTAIFNHQMQKNNDKRL